jgi:hypothetical protein
MLTLTDNLITLRQATRLLPRRRGNRRPHFSTVWRWALHGVRGIKLEAISVGDTLCTTRAALEDFLRRVTEARGISASAVPSPRTSRQAQKAIAEAERRLERAGI